MQVDIAQLLDSIRPSLDSLEPDQLRRSLPGILQYSAFFTRIIKQYPEQITELISCGDLLRQYSNDDLEKKLFARTNEFNQISHIDQALRIFRHIEMIRILWREMTGISSVEQTIRDLSFLADALVKVCVNYHTKRLSDIYGEPRSHTTGERAEFVVLAMGKLGGQELNFSSDIDLIFAYSDIGETLGNKSISNNEYFIKLGQSLINSLNTPTTDGFVYRVDMRLRPNGQSGPLVMSFSAMENYYQIHGREWERYAWIKTRTVAGDVILGEQFIHQLKPFVYRKYLDYQVYQSLEEMKAMINKEIRQEGMQQNVKLGRGGIREIEFITQAHQLVRGGREPELRTRSLKRALTVLAKNQHLPEEVVDKLYRAYQFLRTVEHRLQMQNDQQIHQLPTDSHQLAVIAQSLGLEKAQFEEQLNHHRDAVHTEFTKLYETQKNDESDDDYKQLWRKIISVNDENNDHSSISMEFSASLKAYANSKSYRSLETRGRRIIDQIMPNILRDVAKQKNPAQSLNCVLTVVSAIGGRTAYLSLLSQFPMACTQLAQLSTASPWISKWIAQHPIVLDTLINPRVDLYAFNKNESLIADRLRHELDEELRHDLLRQFHHSNLLHVAIADIHNQYNATQIRLFISNIAESIVYHVVKLCQQELEEKFGRPDVMNSEDYFAVIAYGKLGSQELSYNADLDLVFIYDDQILSPHTIGGLKLVRIDYYFSRLVQRILTMLSMQTAAGKLYDIDTRLRPSGQSGLLVSSLTQYSKYQNEQAWIWEHQALIKARLLGPTSRLHSKFNQLREDILSKPRDKTELVNEICTMRRRMREVKKSDDKFPYKQLPGGMIDIEFISQFIVLANAHQHQSICQSRSVTDIFNAGHKFGLLQEADIILLKQVYADLLYIENQYKLIGDLQCDEQTQISQKLVKVDAIWKKLFE